MFPVIILARVPIITSDVLVILLTWFKLMRDTSWKLLGNHTLQKILLLDGMSSLNQLANVDVLMTTPDRDHLLPVSALS